MWHAEWKLYETNINKLWPSRVHKNNNSSNTSFIIFYVNACVQWCQVCPVGSNLSGLQHVNYRFVNYTILNGLRFSWNSKLQLSGLRFVSKSAQLAQLSYLKQGEQVGILADVGADECQNSTNKTTPRSCSPSPWHRNQLSTWGQVSKRNAVSKTQHLGLEGHLCIHSLRDLKVYAPWFWEFAWPMEKSSAWSREHWSPRLTPTGSLDLLKKLMVQP